jgi:hypothetical protein
MALVLTLAIVPLIRLKAPGAAVATVVALAVVAIVLCGLLRRAWAWYAALVVPAALLAATVWHPALGVLGGLFGLMWAYMLHVRRTVLGGRSRRGG